MKKIVLLGDRDTRFLTHRELDTTLDYFPSDVSATWLATDANDVLEIASEADGIWVVPGTPYKSDEIVYEAIRQARSNDQPFLGTCGGFQYCVVEFARNVAQLVDASHAESDAESTTHIVNRLSCSLVGEVRTIEPIPGTIFSEICGTSTFAGYHFCNFGMADEYIEALSSAGLVISAKATDAGVEAVEIPANKFYLATLFQPQVGTAERGSLHPLISHFIETCIQ